MYVQRNDCCNIITDIFSTKFKFRSNQNNFTEIYTQNLKPVTLKCYINCILEYVLKLK